MQLDQLLATRADLWRGRGASGAASGAGPTGLPSGFDDLDAALSGGGWPRAGLSEVLTAHQGAGLALLLPLLVRLSEEQRWLLWVNPPHVPFPPALAAHGLDLTRILIVRAGADAAWAAEQGLRSGTCAAVLAWTGTRARPQASGWSPAALRRLQLAAAEHDTPALLLRPPAAAGETSPAALRLRLSAREDGLDVVLMKQRGGRPGQRLRLPVPSPLPAQPRGPAQRQTAEPREEPTLEPIGQPIGQPAGQPAEQPASQSVEHPDRALDSVSNPAPDPAAGVVAEQRLQAAGNGEGTLVAGIARRVRRWRTAPRR